LPSNFLVPYYFLIELIGRQPQHCVLQVRAELAFALCNKLVGALFIAKEKDARSNADPRLNFIVRDPEAATLLRLDHRTALDGSIQLGESDHRLVPKPPNEPAHLPGGRGELHTSKSRHARRVR